MMESNLRIYDKGKCVPSDALKPINAGRLKGMSNINPMWRIRKLTEIFGPAGIGWYTEEIGREVYQGSDGEQVASLKINLYVKDGNEWSKPIFGEGGSMLVAKESRGLYTSDEAWKMAYTDALSVACKALGIAADVYYAQERTKYDASPSDDAPKYKKPEPKAEDLPVIEDGAQIDGVPCCEDCGTPFPETQDPKTGKHLSPADCKELAIKLRGAAVCAKCAAKRKLAAHK